MTTVHGSQRCDGRFPTKCGSGASLLQILRQKCATLFGAALVSVVMVLVSRAVIPYERVSHDFVCYWATGKILALGQSPYDARLQRLVQQQYGFNPETDGHGFYEYLPFYYPPSVLMVLCVLFIPLGFPTAKIAWLVFNVELLALSGYLLRHAVKGLPPAVPLVVAPLFALSVISALVGQLAPLTLFLIAVLWRLLDRGWDRTAGWLLAWILFKPQLTVIMLPALLLWAARQRRWRMMSGFAAGFGTLVALATILSPTWPIDLLRLLLETPVPTQAKPWKGATWLLALRAVGLEGSMLWIAYAAAVSPLLWAVSRRALKVDGKAEEVIALSLLAAFFVATYGRSYDYPVLVVPLLLLIGRRLPDLAGAVLLVAWLVVPYLHWWLLGVTGPHHWSFFWIPLLLAFAWVASDRRSAVVSLRASAGSQSGRSEPTAVPAQATP